MKCSLKQHKHTHTYSAGPRLTRRAADSLGVKGHVNKWSEDNELEKQPATSTTQHFLRHTYTHILYTQSQEVAVCCDLKEPAALFHLKKV